MKRIELDAVRQFNPEGMKRNLIHDCPYFRMINFNIAAGQTFPVHSHDTEGELSIVVLEGEGHFLGADGAEVPAKPGDVLISLISEPHGVRATTDLRIVVTIAPPL